MNAAMSIGRMPIPFLARIIEGQWIHATCGTKSQPIILSMDRIKRGSNRQKKTHERGSILVLNDSCLYLKEILANLYL